VVILYHEPFSARLKKIETIQRSHIIDYLKTHYYGPRMVLVATGPIEHETFFKLANKYFSRFPATNGGHKVAHTPAKFVGSDYRHRSDDQPYANFALAFKTGACSDPDSVVLMVIQTMIGSISKDTFAAGENSSSPLIKSIVEENMATQLHVFNTPYSDVGLFGVYGTAEPVGIYDFVEAVCKEFTDLCYQVCPVRLAEAKNSLKLSLLAAYVQQATDEIGRQMLVHGRRIHPLEFIQRIDAVDAEAVKACANRYFYDKDHVLAAKGPLHEFPDYNDIRKQSYRPWS